MNTDQNTSSTSNLPAISPGLAQVQEAVQFTNEQVLQPDVKPMGATAKVVADQAAAMMLQDVRSYLQSNEQVLTIATAKAIAMIMSQNPQEQQAGTKALEAIAQVQTSLPVFASAITTTAVEITTSFN